MKHILSTLLLALCALSAVAQSATSIQAGTNLTTYYATADGKSGSTLRAALQSCITTDESVSYTNLKYLLKYADTQDANGQDIIDIYTTCQNSTSATGSEIVWGTSCTGSASQNVGCNNFVNREHTVPQSWFNEAKPMVSDAFHIYTVDGYSNGHRSNYFYGECPGGTSYSGSECNETGKLGANTFRTDLYSGTVYEVPDEYKGDIARTYFYMATRYADKCANWGNMFGNDNLGLTAYTAALMLKWHREDPVSDKERIRNEVIYGNSRYNPSNYKQSNRNPFIDYPELVELIWGNRAGQSFVLSEAISSYSQDYTGETTAQHTVRWVVNGTVVTTQVYVEGSAIVFPGSVEVPEGSSKVFRGWTDTEINGTSSSAPTLISNAVMGTTDLTFYAVFAESTQSDDDIWQLTQPEDVEEGTYAILTSDGHAFKGTISNGHGQVTTEAFSFTAGEAERAPAGTCEITMTASEDGFTMYNAAHGYLYASAASSGHLAWQNEETSYWSFSSGNWTYAANNAYLRNYQNGSFRTYGINNGDAILFARKGQATRYSDFCTTVALETPMNISAALYSTYYNSHQAYVMPEGMEGYVAYADEDGFHLVKAYDASDVVPAGTALVLKAAQGLYQLTYTTTTGATPELNDLRGTDEETMLENDNSSYFYALTLNAASELNSVGFYWMNETGAAFTNGAHKAYLKLAKEAGVQNHYTFADEVTAVENVEAADVVKFIENGQVLIKKNGAVYNVMGQVVR